MREKETQKKKWSVYIIECADETLYTGIATDVARRFEEHNSGGKKAARYTRGRGPLILRYQNTIGTRSEALKEEVRIKKLPRKSKLLLLEE